MRNEIVCSVAVLLTTAALSTAQNGVTTAARGQPPMMMWPESHSGSEAARRGINEMYAPRYVTTAPIRPASHMSPQPLAMPLQLVPAPSNLVPPTGMFAPPKPAVVGPGSQPPPPAREPDVSDVAPTLPFPSPNTPAIPKSGG